MVVEVWNGSTSGGYVTASNAIELNTWQMFTVTVDASGNTKIYKNAQLIQTSTTAVPQNVVRTRNYIGRSNWSADAYYQGKMDDVRIYSYPLDQTAITNLL